MHLSLREPGNVEQLLHICVRCFEVVTNAPLNHLRDFCVLFTAPPRARARATR
jgi:hypothetical protein